MALPVREWPRAAGAIARTYGMRGASLRALHELRRRSGLFRSGPRGRWRSDVPREHPFRIDAERLARATSRDAALNRADRVVRGEYQAYRWDWRPLPDMPADWLRHPATGRGFDGRVPWWKVHHLDPEIGDIKAVWEPARFGWAYDLVRGYLLTGDDRYARAFHRRLDAWLAGSPPFRGPHWSCGQETAIRAAAVLYAEANLAGAPSSTAAAMETMTRVLAVSGERIQDAFGYALSQRNNHGISEAVGLIFLGVRFRGRHDHAARWLRRGRRSLNRLLIEQFADDGWYIQHSFNYLRLALDQAVLAQRAMASVGDALSPAALDRIAAAVALLTEVTEPTRGTTPNHGPNDGAFVHPITLADYRDYRPALTATCASFGLPLSSSIRPDPETLAWLGSDAPPAGPALRDGVRVGASGWVVARVGETHAFLRAGRYHARPGHLDALHLDLRFQGREVVVDPGTFSYNAPPLDRELTSARVHNGPVLDGREPAVRGPRFLWLTWPEASILEAEWRASEGVATFVAELSGRVRRRVTVRAGEVRVEDWALDPAARELSVRWLLHPDASGVGVEVYRVSGDRATPLERRSTAAWFSPRYEEKIPAPSLSLVVSLESGAALVTRFTSGDHGLRDDSS